MNRSVLLMMLLTLLAAPVSGISEEANVGEGAVLESISYEKDKENLEKIIFKLNGTHIPKIFKIKGEKPRLVFDFIDTRYSDLINNIINTEGNLIKGVRVGIHNDPPKTRVVVDLKPEGKYKFEQDFLIQENILSITFHPTEQKKMQEMVVAQPEQQEKKPEEEPASFAEEKPVAPEGTGEAGPGKSQEALETVGTRGEKQGPGDSGAAKPEAAEKPIEAEENKAEMEHRVVENQILAQITREEPVPIEPLLSNVSFERTANDSEMVLFKLNDFYPPIVFGIEKGNPRVVCDFLDTDLAESVRSVIQTKGTYVSRIRTALHNNPHKVRVVLDLVPNRNYDLQQVFFKEDNLFVIIVNEFEEESVQAPDISESPALTQ